jgi:hypothetical protein
MRYSHKMETFSCERPSLFKIPEALFSKFIRRIRSCCSRLNQRPSTDKTRGPSRHKILSNHYWHPKFSTDSSSSLYPFAHGLLWSLDRLYMNDSAHADQIVILSRYVLGNSWLFHGLCNLVISLPGLYLCQLVCEKINRKPSDLNAFLNAQISNDRSSFLSLNSGVPILNTVIKPRFVSDMRATDRDENLSGLLPACLSHNFREARWSSACFIRIVGSSRPTFWHARANGAVGRQRRAGQP